MGKSKAPSEQTQEVKYPDFVEEAAKSNLELAGQLADQPYSAYGGQLLADISPFTTQQQAQLQNLVTSDPFGSYTGNAVAQANADLSYRPSEVGASLIDRSGIREIDPQNITSRTEALMNPYTQMVINNTLTDMDKARQMTLQRTGDQAQAANAFGGDRHALMEATVNKDFIDSAGNMSAALRNQGYGQAQNLAASGLQFDAGQDASVLGANQAASMSTDQFNVGAGQDAMKARLAAAQLMPGVQSAELSNAMQNANILGTLGQFDQNRNQQELDLAYSKYLEEKNYPTEMLDLRARALGMTPYGSTTTQTASTQAGNPLGGALGGAMAGASLGSMMAAPGATGLAAVGGMPFLLGGALLGGLLS